MKLILLIVLFLVAGCVWSQQSGSGDAKALFLNDRKLVMKNCAGCHDIMYLSPRSRKSWELTVMRMREMIPVETDRFSRSEADQMIDFLSHYLPEGNQTPVYEFFNSKNVNVYLGDTSEPVAGAEEVVKTELTVQAKPSSPPQQFSVKLLKTAKFCGYLSVISLLFMIFTGLMRRKMKHRFVIVHRYGAVVLLLTLAVHSVIYFQRFGMVSVLWYWLGAVGVITTLLAYFVVYLRSKMGAGFIKIHAGLGVATLMIGVLHWIIAYL